MRHRPANAGHSCAAHRAGTVYTRSLEEVKRLHILFLLAESVGGLRPGRHVNQLTKRKAASKFPLPVSSSPACVICSLPQLPSWKQGRKIKAFGDAGSPSFGAEEKKSSRGHFAETSSTLNQTIFQFVALQSWSPASSHFPKWDVLKIIGRST